MDKADCKGCRDDYYNGTGAAECWSFKKAKLVTRWKTGYWTEPTQPGAFTEVRVPDCYRQKGFSFSDTIPDFAINPRRLPRENGAA